MSENELKKWFINKLSSCYHVTHDYSSENIYWFYDESYVRRIKLCKINNQEIIHKSNISGVCLFEQDITSNHIFCDYNKIWKFIENNYSHNYIEIQNFIKICLNDFCKTNIYTPMSYHSEFNWYLRETKKLKIYTPRVGLDLCSSINTNMNKLIIL